MVLDAFLTELLSRGSFFGLPTQYVFAFLAVYQLLACIGNWKVFARAGKVPWHSLIPGLYHYDLYDLCWNGKAGLLAAFVRLVGCLCAPYGNTFHRPRWMLRIYVFAVLAHFVLSGLMKLKLSRSFGKQLSFTFGLIFANEICMFLLGMRPAEYLGRTLYRPRRKREKSEAQKNRDYIIQLYQRRSLTALAASVLVVVFTFRAVAGGLIQNPNAVTPERGERLYRLFTVNSNTLAANGASFMVPYAIAGVRKMRLSFPRWVILLQYSGTICTTLTMIFALTLIWPMLGAIAVTGMNFWLHIICPLLSLVLLFSVETDNLKIKVSDSLLCLLPFYLYALVYIANVMLVGEAGGGWRDIYRLITYFPAVVTAPLMFLLGFGISSLLRVIYNKLSDMRHKRLLLQWADNVDPVEVKVGVFGIGRTTGLHSEPYNITLPLDMLRAISEKYDMPIKDLDKAYITGVEGGVNDREEILEDRTEWISSLAGIPDRIYYRELVTKKDDEEK